MSVCVRVSVSQNNDLINFAPSLYGCSVALLSNSFSLTRFRLGNKKRGQEQRILRYQQGVGVVLSA